MVQGEEERKEQDPDTDLDMDSFLSDLERNSARTSGSFRSQKCSKNRLIYLKGMVSRKLYTFLVSFEYLEVSTPFLF
jgi:hypothetical protein